MMTEFPGRFMRLFGGPMWSGQPIENRQDPRKVFSIIIIDQGTKKFRSNIPGLVDFVVGLVEFILHLPNGQVKVFWEIFL